MGTKEPNMGAINQANLSSALFGKARRAVLALLFVHPEESFYQRQIARTAGVGMGVVQRELQRLAHAGIITKVRRGREVYYQANAECPIYNELKGLIVKTAGLGDVLRESLAPLASKIDLAFVYGSHARSTESATSDVDLMIIGEASDLAVHRAVSQAEDRLSRPVNYSLLSRKEFERRKKEKGGFVARVLKAPKIYIVGDAKDV
jgi:predicted nucleotidyltransferase